ncbi:MAG: DUF2786 domain-containing protein [Polyangiaceae bacterium]
MSCTFERVTKLIALSASPNENEARAAAMQACALMRKHGLSVGGGAIGSDYGSFLDSLTDHDFERLHRAFHERFMRRMTIAAEQAEAERAREQREAEADGLRAYVAFDGARFVVWIADRLSWRNAFTLLPVFAHPKAIGSFESLCEQHRAMGTIPKDAKIVRLPDIEAKAGLSRARKIERQRRKVA